MILAALALQAAAGPALGAIGLQQLPAYGCAAYLWRTGEAAAATGPVAMASADPASLRLRLDGRLLDLSRSAQQGDAGFGLATTADYRGDGVGATLALTVAARADLRDGAAVPQATLTVTRDSGDAIVLPLAGLIGCSTPR